MNDKGTCPHCRTKFEVTEYGYEVDCPNCGKKIDVFPDPVWIETKWGTFGVSGLPLFKILNIGTK